MGNKKATGFLCLRLVPCFAYVGAEDNRKGIPFVKIVSLLCKLIQFLMVTLSVTVHKALILLVFLNHPYQSLAFMGFLGYQNVNKEIIQPNIEKEQQTPKILYFRGFLYILKIYQTPSKHTKMFR